jgi:hypothetical protein
LTKQRLYQHNQNKAAAYAQLQARNLVDAGKFSPMNALTTHCLQANTAYSCDSQCCCCCHCWQLGTAAINIITCRLYAYINMHLLFYLLLLCLLL